MQIFYHTKAGQDKEKRDSLMKLYRPARRGAWWSFSLPLAPLGRGRAAWLPALAAGGSLGCFAF